MKNINSISAVFCILFMLTSCKDLEVIPVQCPEVTAIDPSFGFFNEEVELTVTGLSHDKASFYEVKIQGATIPIDDFDAKTGKILITIPKGTRTGKVTVNYKASTGFDVECSAEAQEGVVFEYMPKVMGMPKEIESNLMSRPTGIDVDDAGNVYVADKEKNRILFINPQTLAVENYIGATDSDGTVECVNNGESSLFYGPIGLAISGSSIFTTEESVFVARKISISGGKNVVKIAGECKEGGGYTLEQFSFPQGIEVTSEGHVLIIDRSDRRVIELTPITGSPNAYSFSVFAGDDHFGSNCEIVNDTKEFAIFCSPYDITIDESTGEPIIYVTEKSDAVIRRITSDGNVSTLEIFNDLGQIQRPLGITNDGKGNLYVADSGSDLIFRINLATNKIFTLTEVSELTKPEGIAFDQSNNLLYITDSSGGKVIQVKIE